jgi:uncharacterized protein (DUF3820 family)
MENNYNIMARRKGDTDMNYKKRLKQIEKEQKRRAKKTELELDDNLPFGKYGGQRIRDVLEIDAQYIVWMSENTDVVFDIEVENEAMWMAEQQREEYFNEQ